MSKHRSHTEIRELKARERADALFVVYYKMGPERSLESLQKVCSVMGLKMALSSFKRFSVKYDWQRRVMEKVVAEREQTEKDALAQIDKMNEEHIKVNKGLMSLAIAGINYWQDQLEKKKAEGKKLTLNFKPGDIIGFVKQGQIGERLARGQATNRSEIIVEVIGTFVQEFALIFKQVNIIADPTEREEEYVRLFDESLQKYYSKVTSQAVKRVESGYEERLE